MTGRFSYSVCFLSQAFPDSEGAYRGIFIQNLACNLIREGLSVVVVTPKIFKISKRFEIVKGIIVHRFFFPSNGKPLIAFKKIPVIRMLIYMTACFFRAFSVIVKYRCKLIHVHWIHPNGIIGVALSAILKIPLVVHVRGSDLHTYGMRNRFFKFLTHFVLMHTNMILCTNVRSRNDIMAQFSDVTGDKFEIVYNEVDSTLFHPLSEKTARRKLGLNLEGIHFVFIGNFREEKGVRLFFEVAANLFSEFPSGFFHFVGDGELTDEMIRDVGRLKISSGVKIHGPVAHEQIPLWLNAANALILPSDREGMPNVVLEALACGIPVIASDTGDTGRFIKEDENGFLLTGDRKIALRTCLTKILSGPESLFKMKKKLQTNNIISQSSHKGTQAIMKVYASLSGLENFRRTV
jgi:glycosyltransferase involved in cell wall biosynthesis